MGLMSVGGGRDISVYIKLLIRLTKVFKNFIEILSKEGKQKTFII